MIHRAERVIATIRHPGRIFYGWRMVAAGSLSLALWSGAYTYGTSALFVPVIRDLATTSTALSGAFSMIRVESGLLGPIEGVLIDRLGPRPVMLLGFILLGLGLVLLSLAHSLLAFYGFFFLLAVGASLCGHVPVTASIVKWFRRRRALALSVVMMGTPIGGALVPVVAWAVSNHGWRPTVVGMGVFVWLAGIPLSLAMRHRPEQYGLRPDGEAFGKGGVREASGPGTARRALGPQEERSLTVGQAVKTPAFWLIATGHSMALIGWGALVVHQIPALMDMGISYQMAATVLGMVSVFTLVGRGAAGVLGDRWGKQRLAVVAFGIQAAAVLVLAVADNLALAFLFAFLLGLGFGSRGVMLISLRGDFFGPKAFATITGVAEPILMAGALIGPLFAAFIYDTQQSYRLAFILIAAITLLGGLLVAAARPPRLRASP